MKTNDKDVEKMCLEFIDLNFNFEMCGNAEKKMFIDDSLKVYKAGFKACEAMKTNDLRNLSETYASLIADQAALAFCDGFKACEAKMLESAAGDFDEYWRRITANGFMWVNRKDLHQQTFTAGAMSQAKRIKELEDALKIFAAGEQGAYGEQYAREALQGGEE
jgi:hypothetical protein